MKITSIKFYRLTLLLPYLAIVILLPFFLFGLGPQIATSDSNPPDNASEIAQVLSFVFVPLALISFFYFYGAPYWLPPYTVLVIFLWVWSLKRNKAQIYRMFIWSPIYLAVLTTIFYVLVSYLDLFSEMNYLGKDILPSILICIFPATIAFGYLFIGLTAWIYDFLRRRGIIVNEEESILNLEDMKS